MAGPKCQERIKTEGLKDEHELQSYFVRRIERFLNSKGRRLSGWDEIREFKVDVKNTREVPVKVEIQRNFPTQHWELEKRGEIDAYEKVDLDTVKFTLELAAGSKKQFGYVLTTRHGRRAE